LSAYNILLAGTEHRIIDVPQAIDARVNLNTERLLARDFANVSRYFARQGARRCPEIVATELLERYLRGVP